MSAMQTDKRRLHDRFQINVKAMLYQRMPTNGNDGLSVTAIDVSIDGNMTCLGQVNESLPIGTEVLISFLGPKQEELYKAKIISLGSGGPQNRIGLKVAQEGIETMRLLAMNAPKVDRRKEERRQPANPAEKDRDRQFDRRGFWSGLKSKRGASERVWKAKNFDMYFYMKPLQSGTGAHVIVDGHEMIMMSSNNYLGLSIHPKVKEAAIEAIKKYGSSPSASSLLGGTLDIHIQLEEELAKFKGVEATCVFSSGYVTNMTTLTTLLGKGDAVFNDNTNHASLIDGSRLSGAEFRIYNHCDTEDLEKKLKNSKPANKLVATDSVFSMDGDIAPLPEIFRLCKKYNAGLMVDEAHATGVFGNTGRGLLEHYGMEGKVDILMGTLSKSLSGTGGFIGGSRELIRILKHSARAFVFSAYLPPSICAAVMTCLKLIDEEPERRINLWRNTEKMRAGLQGLGFNTGNSQSPIIPIIFPTEEQTNVMTRELRTQGIYVSPVLYPGVKRNATRVRLTVMATHSDEDIEKALHVFNRLKWVLAI